MTGNGKHTTYENGDLGGWFIIVVLTLRDKKGGQNHSVNVVS